MTGDGWRDGHARLRGTDRRPARAGGARRPGPPARSRSAAARLVATGIGSSEAHARLLAHLVAERTGRRARFVPASALLAPGAAPAADTLVVFSQGLSPNARLVLAHVARWRQRRARDGGHRRRSPGAAARPRRDVVVSFAGEDEYGTLVRVTGPLAGYLCAIRLARAFGVPVDVPAERIEPALAAAFAAARRVAAAALWRRRSRSSCRGPTASWSTNLRLKVLEGMLRPLPAGVGPAPSRARTVPAGDRRRRPRSSP